MENAKKILSLLCAFVMTASAVGCEKEKSDTVSDSPVPDTTAAEQTDVLSSEEQTDVPSSETKHTSEPLSEEEKTSETSPNGNTYEIGNFSLTLNENYEIEEAEEYADSDLCLVNKENPVIVAFIKGISFGVPAKGQADSFRKYLDESTVISYGDYENPYFDAAEVQQKLSNGESEIYSDTIIVCEQNSMLTIVFGYTESDKNNARDIKNEILASLEYTSDFFFPTEPQTVENDYVSVYFQPKWCADREVPDRETDTRITLRYSHPETIDTYLTNLSIQILTDTQFNTAREYADDRYSAKQEKPELFTDLKMEQAEILGFASEAVSFDQVFVDAEYTITSYYFEHNGTIFTVTTTIPIGCDDIETDINELIEGITIK